VVCALKLSYVLLLLALTSPVLAAGQGWFIVFQHYWSYYSPHMLEVIRFVVYCSSPKPEPNSSFMVVFEVINRGTRAVKLRSLYVLAQSPSGKSFKIGVQSYVKLTIEPGERKTYRSLPFNLSEPGVWTLAPAYSTGSWSGSPANWPRAEILVGELPAPDIHLAEADVGEPRAGEEVKVRVKAENTGEKPAEFKVELRVDGELASNTTLDLRPGEAVIAELEWTPEEPGDYILEVIADPEQEVEEHNEEDNKLALEVHVGAPDLTIEAIDLPPQAPPGEVEGKALIANRGDATSPKAELKVHAGSYMATLEVPEIPPGGLAEVEFKLEAQRRGELIVTLVVNPEAEFVEWNHRNNMRQAKLMVVEEKMPDLKVEPVFKKIHTTAGLPAEIPVYVSNQGEAPSQEAKLVARVAGEKVAEASVPPLDPMEVETVVLRWTPPEPGEYTVAVEVDPEHKVKDADRGNNLGNITLAAEEAEIKTPTPATSPAPPPAPKPTAQPTQPPTAPQPPPAAYTEELKRMLIALAVVAAALIAVIAALARPRRPSY